MRSYFSLQTDVNVRKRQHDIICKQKKQKRPVYTISRHLWLMNYVERISTNTLALGYPLLGPSRHVRAYYVCRSPALTFSAAIHFAMKRPAPCPATCCLKKIMNAPRPPEHPPVRGKTSKPLGGITTSKEKNSS